MRDENVSRRLAETLLEQIADCVDDDRLDDKGFWTQVAARISRRRSSRQTEEPVFDQDVASELDAEDDGDRAPDERTRVSLSSALAAFCCEQIEAAIASGHMTQQEESFWSGLATDLVEHRYEPGATEARSVVRAALRRSFADLDRAVIALAVAVAAQPMYRALARLLRPRRVKSITFRGGRGGSRVFNGPDPEKEVLAWYNENWHDEYARGVGCVLRQFLDDPGCRAFYEYEHTR
jgi:hypothetical protein